LFCYLIISIAASSLIDNYNIYYADGAVDLETRLTTGLAKMLTSSLIPLQKFEVSDQIADGEVIELKFISELFLFYFLLRAVPFMLVGIFIYRRRELGLVIKQ
jgi:hypothetical protein